MRMAPNTILENVIPDVTAPGFRKSVVGSDLLWVFYFRIFAHSAHVRSMPVLRGRGKAEVLSRLRAIGVPWYAEPSAKIHGHAQIVRSAVAKEGFEILEIFRDVFKSFLPVPLPNTGVDIKFVHLNRVVVAAKLF